MKTRFKLDLNLILFIFIISLFVGVQTGFTMTWPKGTLPAPPGTNLFALFLHDVSASSVYADGNEVDNSANLNAKTSVLRYLHYFDTEMPIDINFYLPFGKSSYERSSIGFDQTSSGIGDIVINPQIYFYQNKSINLNVFFSLLITVPTGEYDKDKSINMGSNRWTFTPELGFNWTNGKWTFESVQHVELSTENDEYVGDHSLENDPAYEIWQLLSYNFNPKVWMGIGHSFYFGGEGELDGVSMDNEKDTKSVSIATGFIVNSNNSVLLGYKHNYDVENGTKCDQITLRFCTWW